jgi:Flp pilus assembly protein TadG
MRHIVRDERGGAVVEYAIVSTLYMFILLGAISTGLAWWTENSLQIAAALTARCTALGTCTSSTYAVAAVKSWMGISAINSGGVSVTTSSTCFNSSGSYSQFTKVTLTSYLWKRKLVWPLSENSISASACFPNPVPS